MFKKSISFALIGMTVAGMVACNGNKSFKTTKNGLEYRIVKDEKGEQKPSIGDLVQIHLHIKANDSVMFDTRKMNNNQPIEIPVMTSAFKGDWTEGLTMMTAGDSAVFRVSADSIKKRMGELPPFIKEGDKIVYEVVMVSVKSQAQAQKEQQDQASKQGGIDDQILREYFAKNNLQPQKTESGLYYIIDKEGTGETVKKNQTVSVMYTGKTLDGQTFDSNIDAQFGHTDPLEFPVGTGSVIAGWDEGIQLLKKGSKARLFIPSQLAYGQQSPSPSLPANSILMFDVEVKDIK
jgi:FKBP-type peptidyl-prolyl cis-trans isomerase